jgi:hypothetical protein
VAIGFDSANSGDCDLGAAATVASAVAIGAVAAICPAGGTLPDGTLHETSPAKLTISATRWPFRTAMEVHLFVIQAAHCSFWSFNDRATENAINPQFVRRLRVSAMEFQQPSQIAGIVLIDEADLHLHLGLQFDVLPSLIALFPKIQFVISVHAPLVALGLEKALGSTGFEIREMPTGQVITPESYSEFQTAFDFQNSVLQQVNAGTLPALLVEGKTDASLIATAWEKLNPGIPMPFEPIPCGVEPNPEKQEGGADMLRRCTEFLSIVSDRKITALFDNDGSGCNNFNSLSVKAGFATGTDDAHKRHAAKPMQAILLPAPPNRVDFSSSQKALHRYLAIEHYFSDALLTANGLKADPVAVGSHVFEIDASSAKKVAFAEAVKDLDVDRGVDKVIHAAEMYQLPAPDFRVGEMRTTALLFAHQDFADMSKGDRVRACYQHCCLMYVTNQRMSNQSLQRDSDLAQQPVAHGGR